jgi:hypothetical protein
MWLQNLFTFVQFCHGKYLIVICWNTNVVYTCTSNVKLNVINSDIIVSRRLSVTYCQQLVYSKYVCANSWYFLFLFVSCFCGQAWREIGDKTFFPHHLAHWNMFIPYRKDMEMHEGPIQANRLASPPCLSAWFIVLLHRQMPTRYRTRASPTKRSLTRPTDCGRGTWGGQCAAVIDCHKLKRK